VNDFPKCWHDHDLTVEVEAKANEVSVMKLQGELAQREQRHKFRPRPEEGSSGERSLSS
jgi:hypothetical protein